jgi:hypothetical protein
MVSFSEGHFRTFHLFDTRYPEIAVFLPHVAPGDQMPVEGVKYQTNRLHLPYTGFIAAVFIMDVNDTPGRNGVLQYR